MTVWGWLIWKLGWTSTLYSEQNYFGLIHPIEGWKAALLGVWLRWDVVHYIRIVEQGYEYDYLSVFFPLFPLLGRAASRLPGIDSLSGLMLVSNLCLVLLAALLYEIAVELDCRMTAQQTVISLFIYPMAIFLFAPYTESLALFLIILTYLAAHRRKWWLSIPASIAAGLSRGTVLPLTSLLLWDLWQNRKSLSRLDWTAGIITSGGPLAGIGLFLAWRMYMGFPEFDRLLAAYWGRQTVWPWEPFLAISDFIQQGKYTPAIYLNLLLLVIVVGISIWALPRLPVGFSIYQFIALVFTLSTSLTNEPLGSWGRYSLILFPTYIGLGLWCNKPRRRLYTFGFLVMLMLLVAGQYFMWGWLG